MAKRNISLKNIRKSRLENNTVEMLGHEFNARPKDKDNILAGIEKNDTIWPDVDDYMVDVTVENLQYLLSAGLTQAELIWDEYKQAAKASQSN